MPQAGDAKGDYHGTTVRDDIALNAWLAKRPTEAPLEPDLPIIDPHHHFWDHPIADTTYCLNCWPISAVATTSYRLCSSNAERCIARRVHAIWPRWAKSSSSPASRR